MKNSICIRRQELLKENLYESVLDCGMSISVIRKKGYTKKYAVVAIDFGSIDNRFVIDETGEEVELADGIAHFLEHKLFEEEFGSIEDEFAKLGAYTNAFTNHTMTGYLFSCTDNFEESLKTLLSFVSRPYFTDENVEKEKGIIGQEIMMYDDDPDWKGFTAFLEAMYHENPVRIDIAGSIESISPITKEMLYKCYNSFYQPSNLSLFIIGDIEPTETIEFVNEFTNSLLFPTASKVTKIVTAEPKTVKEQKKSIKMSVSLPQLYLGYKINDSYMCEKDILRTSIISEILMEMFIGKSSTLYEKLYSDSIIDGSFDWQSEVEKKFAFIMVSGRSTDVEELEQRISNGVRALIENGIDREDFERVKKQIMGSAIRGFNSLEYITYNFLAYKLRGTNLLDRLEIVHSISADEVEKFAREVMREESKVVVTVMPIK